MRSAKIARGFPLRCEIKGLWDEHNTCALMMKSL